MENHLKVEAVSKIFNRNKPDELTALDSLDLEIAQGEVVALTGPSGSGKTTLLSLLGCMSRPTSGRIYYRDKNISGLPEHFLASIRRESFGFIFQQYNLIRDLSVLENILLPLYPTDLPWKEMQAQAQVLLERFDLSEKKSRKVRVLSGGEQQRVAIARALIADPDVIIADEPTAHLDQALSQELLRIFAELSAEGRTIIVATHDPFVYRSGLVQRRVELVHGRLQEAGKP